MASLHAAAQKGRVSEVVALLAGGADVDAEQGSARWTALHYASENDHAGVVRALIDAGAEVNEISDLDQDTPLFVAAHCENLAICKMLLAAGADPNIGRSPYFRALIFGRKSVLALLLQHGAAMVTTDRHVDIGRYGDFNASAWRFHDRVVEAGGYDAFKKIQRFFSKKPVVR